MRAVANALGGSGEFDEVWPPVPGWVAAAKSLPGQRAFRDDLPDVGYLFVEGRHRISDLFALESVAADGFERLDRFSGDFGFVRFSDGEAVAVRSCAGRVPLYVHSGRGRIAIGTRLDYFVRFLPERMELDPLVCAIAASGNLYFPDSRTYLSDVSIVARARRVSLRADREPIEAAYWDPRPHSGQDLVASPDHSRRLRELLVATLEEELDPAGANLLTLSGGVDSSSLAALAAGTLGLPVSTLTLLPVTPEAQARERAYVDALAATSRSSGARSS